MSALEEQVEKTLEDLAKLAASSDAAMDTYRLPLYQARATVLSGYASYKLEKAVRGQTQELIKWSKRLVYATGSLAFFTFILALVTSLKP